MFRSVLSLGRLPVKEGPQFIGPNTLNGESGIREGHHCPRAASTRLFKPYFFGGPPPQGHSLPQGTNPLKRSLEPPNRGFHPRGWCNRSTPVKPPLIPPPPTTPSPPTFFLDTPPPNKFKKSPGVYKCSQGGLFAFGPLPPPGSMPPPGRECVRFSPRGPLRVSRAPDRRLPHDPLWGPGGGGGYGGLGRGGKGWPFTP